MPRPALVSGQDVLLVDDIYTTGATARAASAALLKAGAASVQVLTVARAQREGVALWSADVTLGRLPEAPAPDASGPKSFHSGQSWEPHV